MKDLTGTGKETTLAVMTTTTFTFTPEPTETIVRTSRRTVEGIAFTSYTLVDSETDDRRIVYVTEDGYAIETCTDPRGYYITFDGYALPTHGVYHWSSGNHLARNLRAAASKVALHREAQS